MKVFLLSLACCFSPLIASAFTSLNFEGSVVTGITPPGFVDWANVAPGWTHSSGSDTSAVLYGITHAAASQMYVLIDSTIPEASLLGPTYLNEPLSGRFSLMLQNAAAIRMDCSPARAPKCAASPLRPNIAPGPHRVRS